MTETDRQTRPATLDDVVALLQKNQDTLDQLLIWTRIGGNEKLKKSLESALDTPQKKLVYHLSDGRPIRDVAEDSKVGIGTISGYWSSWGKIGLMKTKSVKRGERSIRVFDLQDLGIEVPKPATKQGSTPPTGEQAVTPTVQPKIGEGEQ